MTQPAPSRLARFDRHLNWIAVVLALLAGAWGWADSRDAVHALATAGKALVPFALLKGWLARRLRQEALGQSDAEALLEEAAGNREQLGRTAAGSRWIAWGLLAFPLGVVLFLRHDMTAALIMAAVMAAVLYPLAGYILWRASRMARAARSPAP